MNKKVSQVSRSLLLALIVLLVQSVEIQAQNVSEKTWERYKTWASGLYPERDVALAVAPNGSWYSHFGISREQAKAKALNGCKYSQHNPSNAPCNIVDVNFDSESKRAKETRQLVTSGSTEPRSNGQMSDIELECYEAFHRAGGRWWKRNIITGDIDSDFNVVPCFPFVSRDMKTWVGSTSEPTSTSVATTNTSSSAQGWCATKYTVFKSTNAYCDTKGGRWNWTYNAAKAEHLRLKHQPSTITKTTEVVDSQPAEIDKSALELEFWKTIKDSDDPDMFREYLRQFPSGVYAGLARLKIKSLAGSTTSVAKTSIPDLDYGDYYALVIGNNRYQNLRDLRSAVDDAKAISSLLEIDYGFNVELLENATRKDILQSLKRLRETARAKDNVLIYYAGHGSLDQAADEGYWLPVDAERDDDSNWLLTDRVTSQVKAMKAKHVMVVADSCFSGTITRAIKIEQRTPEWLSEIVKKKARTALTSGGLEPVLDTGSGNHSAFAHAFISLLEENNGVLDASQLFSQLRPKVMVNSTQTPQYGKIHMAGDDGGDFLFVRQ